MRNRKLLAGAALAVLMAGTMSTAQAAAPAYLNGGIGKDEAARLHAAAKDYSLQIEFSERRDNEFIADADLKIADARGKTVFQRSDAGPIVLVRLAPGTYRVTATADGRSETQTTTVASHGTASLYFHWDGVAKATAAKPLANNGKPAS